MYQVNAWIHILMASVWVGGLLYTAVIVVPFTLGRPREERQQILRGLARRFRWIGWAAIAVAVLTGLGSLSLRLSPIRLAELIKSEAFYPNQADALLVVWLPWKLFLVVTMILLMLLHDIMSMRAARSHRDPSGSNTGSRIGTIAAGMATLVALAVLYVSVRLVRR